MNFNPQLLSAYLVLRIPRLFPRSVTDFGLKENSENNLSIIHQIYHFLKIKCLKTSIWAV